MTSITDKDIQNFTGLELLSYIQEEKRQLEKKGLLKKQKPFPSISDEIKPFQLPDKWQWVRLGDISRKIHYGYTASATDKDTGVKMLRITDIQDNKVNWSYVPYCEIDNVKLESTRLYPNDILFARTGGTVGKSFLVKEIEGVSVFASYLIRVQLMEPINPEFIKFFFESSLYWKQITDAVTGTGQPNVNATSLSQLMVPIPSLTEQAEIVTKLKRGTMLTESVRANVAHEKKELVRYRQAILQEAMQGEIVEQDQGEGTGQNLLASIQLQQRGKKTQDSLLIEEGEIPYRIPGNWTWTTLKEIGEWGAGSTPSRTNVSYYNDGTIPWIKTGDLNDGLLSKSNEMITVKAKKERNMKIRKKGDILIAMYGATVGKLAILDIEATTNQACCSCSTYDGVSNMYLFYYLKSKKEDFISASFGGAQPNISKNLIEKTLIPLPPFAEQQRIVEKLNTIMALCDRLQEELETTKTEAEKWYRAVMQEAFQPEVE